MLYYSELPSQIQAVEVLCKVEGTCNGIGKQALQSQEVHIWTFTNYIMFIIILPLKWFQCSILNQFELLSSFSSCKHSCFTLDIMNNTK